MKTPFYSNYEMQRREIQSDGYPNPTIGNVANSAIHGYGPNQLPAKQTAAGIKGRFANAAMQDGYFQGYYKQEFYGNEFGHPHANKTLDQKPEFHHIKADFHHGPGVKSELSHPKLADFHHGKAAVSAPVTVATAAAAANFHQNHQSFYSQQQQQQHTVPQNHQVQVPIQYPNQYYPNDFDAAPNLDPTYYEQRAAAGAQTNYYDGSMYQPQAQVQPPQQQQYDYASAPAGAQLQHDGCDNYAAYPQQYFEGGAGPVGPVNAQLHATAAITSSHHGTHGAHGPHVAHGQMHSGQVPQSFNHPPHAAYHAQQHANGLNGNATGMGHHLDNSNSSSDFNFLSNLANDFAPEYYQLS